MGRKRKTGVRKASESSIEISFTYRGERCREKIRLEPTPANLRRAERHRAAILEAIETGTFEYQVTFPNSRNALRFGRYTGGNITVREFLMNWLESKRTEIRASTFDGYDRIIRNQIIPEFGKRRLDQLTRIDVKRWCMEMDCGMKRIRNVTSVFRAALQDAVYDNVIQSNPLYNWQFRRNDPPRPQFDEIDPFSQDELAAIFAILKGQNLHLVQFWSETGLRTSELVALEWGDVDFIQQRVNIWKAKTDASDVPERPKTAAGNRVIDLSPVALTALERQKEHTYLAGGEIFQNPITSQPWTGDRQIREILWRPLLKRAGVRYRYPYQLRHTFASSRLMSATSIGEIMHISRILGHRDWVFTAKTYSRFIRDDFFSHQQREAK